MISLSLSKFLSLSPSFDDDEKIPRAERPPSLALLLTRFVVDKRELAGLELRIGGGD